MHVNVYTGIVYIIYAGFMLWIFRCNAVFISFNNYG
ncbi:hypothetical protein ACT7DH_10065 [Bacillus pacificus]